MNNSKRMNQRYIDIIIFIIFIIIVAGGYLLDNGLSNYLPKWILIDSSKTYDLKFSVFSAQVSISTLGIALVAILGVLFKEVIYGVNILNYLTNDKPLIFKHKINIILQLSLIFISYICIAFDNYNMLISIFFISILIILIMVIEVFNIFKGTEYFKNEIYNYILWVFSKNKLHKNSLQQSIIIGLKNDTLINIEKNNIPSLKDNFYLFNKILESITNYNEADKTILLELFEDSISSILNQIFEENDAYKVRICMNLISKLYKTCNDSNRLKVKNKTYIDIYERVYNKIFSAMRIIILENIEDENIIINLQYELYNNINFEKNSENMSYKNNKYLDSYSIKIYNEIKRKESENFNIKSVYDLKEKLFITLESYIKSYDFEINKINQIYIQLYEYTKILIDNNEKEVLNNVFFKKMHNDTKYIEYKLIMIIYIYCLIDFKKYEKSTIEGFFNNDIRALGNDYKNYTYDLLRYNQNFKFDEINIDNIRKILSKWNKRDTVVYEFMMFWILERNLLNTQVLREELKLLFKGNELSIYNYLDARESMVKKYIIFYNIFLKLNTFEEVISIETAEYKISCLEYELKVLCKEVEINKSKKEIKTEEDYNIIKNNIRNKTLQNINEKLQKFNHKANEKIFYKNIELLNIPHIDIVDLSNSYKINNIINNNESYIIKYIVSIINENLKKDYILTNERSLSDKNLIVKFFEIHNNIEFKTDTLILVHDYFHRLNDVNKFREFEKNKLKLQSRLLLSKNHIIAIDSSKLYFNIKNIIVEIKNIDIDEVCEELDTNENGEYLYNIINDEYIPFTKEELKIYLDNKKCNITIKADIEYSFNSEYIGVGVFLK